MGVQPHHRKRQRPKTQQCNHDTRCGKVPFFRLLFRTFASASVKELAAVPALDGKYMNVLGTKRTFLPVVWFFRQGLRLLLGFFCVIVCNKFSFHNTNYRLLSKSPLRTFLLPAAFQKKNVFLYDFPCQGMNWKAECTDYERENLPFIEKHFAIP
jgi:hypothetical protein